MACKYKNWDIKSIVKWDSIIDKESFERVN